MRWYHECEDRFGDLFDYFIGFVMAMGLVMLMLVTAWWLG